MVDRFPSRPRIRPAGLLGALLALLGAGCATPGAPPPADRSAAAAAEARDADVAMAAAVAALDAEAFLGHVAPDAVFFSARGPSAGRAVVGHAWAPFFAPDGPRLTWAPDRAIASPSGDLVFTFGHADFTPAGGGPPEAGRYLTAWRRGEDGLLRAALDGSDRPLPPLPEGVVRRPLRSLASDDGTLHAEGGLLLDAVGEAGWYLRLARRTGDRDERLAEAGVYRGAP